MEKFEDIKQRMFILKKRLRQVDMNEMFEGNNKSIIEIYEKACKKNQPSSNSANDLVNKTSEVKKNSLNLKVVKDGPISIIKPNFFSISDREKEPLSEKIEKTHEREEIHPVKTQNSADGKSISSFSTTSKLHTLIDKKQIPCEVKETTNSSSSEKKQKQTRDKDKRTHKIQSKIQRLPANNLLNMDEWQNVEKFSVGKHGNQSMLNINNTLNIIKKELIGGNGNVSDSAKAGMVENSSNMDNSSNVTNLGIIYDNSGKSTGNAHDVPILLNSKTLENVPAISFKNTAVHIDNKPGKLEIEIKNENNEENNSIVPVDEKKIQVDDSFYDQKEELFANNLPPEVMGGTPEFQKEDEIVVVKNEDDLDENIQRKFANSTDKDANNKMATSEFIDKSNSNFFNVKEEAKVLNLTSNTNISKNLSNSTGTKITIPNTFNNETVLNAGSKHGINIKKNVRIIDDDDEEEELCSSNFIKENPNSLAFEKKAESLNLPNTVSNYTVSSKIKIPLDFKDFKSPLISEGGKSAKSSKSVENTESGNSNSNAIKDRLEDKTYDMIVVEKRNLKSFIKNVKKSEITNPPESNNANVNRTIGKKMASSPSPSQPKPASAPVNTRERSTFKNRLEELIEAKSKQIKETNPSPSNGNNNIITIAATLNSREKLNMTTNSYKEKPLTSSQNEKKSAELNRNKLETNNNNNTQNSHTNGLDTNRLSEISTNTSNKDKFSLKELQTSISSAVANVSQVLNTISTLENQTTSTNNQTRSLPNTNALLKNESDSNYNIEPIITYDEKIEKKNHIACFIISLNETVTQIKDKLLDSLSKNQSSVVEIKTEFDSIKTSILDTLTEDNTFKGIKILSEKFAKLLAKIFDVLNNDDYLDKFNPELSSLTESAIEFLKKILHLNYFEKEKHNTKFINSLKIIFKFLMNLFKMKGSKNKFNQTFTEVENFVKENKKNQDKSALHLNSLLKFCKMQKSSNKSVEKLLKILNDEELKHKIKKMKNLELAKNVERLKDLLLLNPVFMNYSNLNKIVKSFNDLIFNYLNDD